MLHEKCGSYGFGTLAGLTCDITWSEINFQEKTE